MAPKKKAQSKFQLHMIAGKATPAPPVWPMLWQYGLNIWMVVKEFNDKTREIAAQFWGFEVKVPVNFTVYIDRSYSLEILPPLTSHLILWKMKLKAGSAEPNKKKIWKVSKKDLMEIAEMKKSVMNTRNMDSLIKSIAWTAKSLGLEVEL